MQLFDDIKEMVYQIRVIDIASGNKYSIGSGFLVSDAGHVATNFHVVAPYVHEPQKYRLEYVHHDGEVRSLSVVATDVVNDLALVHDAQSSGPHLPLAAADLSKGDRIYSMGNPQDLGMTIIEGTYNGLVENTRHRKILFSGSLNAGMSGGPALNASGEVIGVNVSKGGEQLSFLVPVNHLAALVSDNPVVDDSRDHISEITAALLGEQQMLYEELMSKPPVANSMGSLQVLEKWLDPLRCWGHSADEEDVKYDAVHQHCRLEDQIYVSQELEVGFFYYDFELVSTQDLNRFQFYHVLEERFSHRGFSNSYDDEQVTPYRCHDDVVEMGGHRWKVSSCFRAYIKFEGLYDASMAMVSMDYRDTAAVATIGASGVSVDTAVSIFRTFAESVTWKP